MSLNKTQFETKYNDSGAGLYRDGQGAAAITPSDHRTLITDIKESFLNTQEDAEVIGNLKRTGNSASVANGIEYTRILTDFAAASSSNAGVITSSEISDGESVGIIIQWTAKRDSANTGAGGEHICNWTKSGGVLVRSFEDDTRKGNNTGTTISVTTSDSGGNIVANISVSGSAFNISGSWIARVIRKH